MPAVLEKALPTVKKLQEGIRIRREIAKLEKQLRYLFGGSNSTVNSYGFSADEMNTVGARLHAKAKKRIAAGRSKEFTGSIEAIL